MCMTLVEHELKKFDMWRSELVDKKAAVEADKGSSQAKKQLEKAQKQFDSLLKKQDQLLRGLCIPCN